MERSLITLTRPAVVQPGSQCLASHAQWRRNRNGGFTHCRPLTNDLGRGHGVGGSADGYMGTNTTPHTVTLDWRGPPLQLRLGTAHGRVVSTPLPAPLCMNRLASLWAGRPGADQSLRNSRKLVSLPFYTDHCPCGSPHPAASVLRFASRHLEPRHAGGKAFRVRQTPAATTRPCRVDYGLDDPHLWQRIVGPSMRGGKIG